jgi:predicted transposase/invertase (TIGR01784 family)
MKTSDSLPVIGRYADILLDRWFKRSFKEFGNASRLMLLFLQALIPERKIASLTYTPEESTNQNPDGKSVRVDVECTDENGQRFVVEVQRSEQHDFYDRAVFNSTFAIQRQLREGAVRFGFMPVYFIGIMRFSLHPESDQFLYRYSLTERESGEQMTDDLHYIFLEVNKCHAGADASLIEKVGYALNHFPTLEGKPDGFDEEIFDLLFSSADLHKFAPEDKIKYINDMTTERDIKNQIDFAYDKGEAKGRAKGRTEGRAEGKAEGQEEKAYEIALRMMRDNVDPELILKYTGLTEEQILALK